MSQPGITSLGNKCALFLTLHLNHDFVPLADLKSIIRSIFKLVHDNDQHTVNYTIGFGNKVVNQLNITSKPFQYKERSYMRGRMPATDGDIFVHLKHDEHGILTNYAFKIKNAIPQKFIKSFEDIYGFVYLDNRDLSGFIDGINNPKTEQERAEFGIDSASNSSFIITQKWIHDFDKISNMEVPSLEECVGRTLNDGTELEYKSSQSHVARIKGGQGYKQKPKFRIVRQSMPFGTISNGGGLFFIAYSKCIDSFEFMLDRMVERNNEDGCFKFSTAVSGNYWLAPSLAILDEICDQQ